MSLNAVQIEAIATANAHASNVGLPTYSELVHALHAVLDASRGASGRIILDVPQEAALRRALGVLCIPVPANV